MQDLVFTAITFSPVTEFIEKTRKLRDLYGSSFILSYLAESICRAAQQQLGQDAVVSPALLNITMGTPNVIAIEGNFSEKEAKKAFFTAWGNIVDACRVWICQNCNDWIEPSYQQWVKKGQWVEKEQWHPNASRPLPWEDGWQLWKNHAWELFWVQAPSIPAVLEAISNKERNDRNWVGINWMGESSTLSGADAIAWPGLDLTIPAKQRRMTEADVEIRQFYQVLNRKIGEAILKDDLSNHQGNEINRLKKLANRYSIDPEHQSLQQELAIKLGEAIVTNREQLSIPELTKRLSTLKTIAQSETLNIQFPDSFKDVNLWTTDRPMGWFRGDGDRAGEHIRRITADPATAVENLRAFSRQMRHWAEWLLESFDRRWGRIVFAGGDDFLGVFYADEEPTEAIDWLCRFKENVWHQGQNGTVDRKPITPSIGFVWASPQVPQRDILQHCELAERTAKDSGRDRVCLRVLFSSGNHLEWTCPWWLLPRIVHGYRDRNGQQDWTHFYKDVADLKARHGFRGNHQVALALFHLFFTAPPLLPVRGEDLFAPNSPLWTHCGEPDALTGVLSDQFQEKSLEEQQTAFNDWVISLAEVGFYLFNRVEVAQASYNRAT